MLHKIRPSTQKITSLLMLTLMLASVITGIASAQGDNPDGVSADDVNAIARQLFCPVCENTPLDVCPTQACAQWRAMIREKLVAGWSEDEIKQYFVDQYGARALSEPPLQGFNWLVYIVPPFLFVIGAYILYRGVRSWYQVDDDLDQSFTSEPIDDEYLARFEDQLDSSQK
ncbi:MAG: cytochrome c-type biogenesis protein CcmH [Chloroflexi bacterium]|nr:cytochrome c-type biogenesis protein CcmH [Chloroflexota bacterium]